MVMLAHDRGSSVAIIHATSVSRGRVEHLFITNGNILSPSSNLTQAQRLMNFYPATGSATLAQAAPEQLAVGMGQATYSPPRGTDDPEIQALTVMFGTAAACP